jgi:hypothetical protein
MRLRIFSLGLLIAFCLILPLFANGDPTPPSPPLGSQDYVPGEILVRFQKEIPQADVAREAKRLTATSLEPAVLHQALLDQENLKVTDRLPELDVQRTRMPSGTDILTLLNRLRASPLIQYCEPNYRVRACFSPLANGPNDDYYQHGYLGVFQWWLADIQADRVVAEHILDQGAAVTIAIIDSGIWITHEDLSPRLVPGIDLVIPNGNANDDYGHGTHVAGIAAAATNNSLGIAGTAGLSAIQLMPVKVLDSTGSGDYYTVSQGILWAANHGARVLNLSLAGGQPAQTLRDAVNYAHNQGCVVVAAAGNFASQGDPVMYPAAYPEVIAVAACDSVGARAEYSEYGDYVDLAAPGGTGDSDAGCILSTLPGGSTGTYGYRLSPTQPTVGTSMAAPMVAGAAAMLLAQDPLRTPEQVENLMTTTAEKTGWDAYNNGWNRYLGWGRLNLYRALVRSATFQPLASGNPSYNYPNPFRPGIGQKTYIVVPLTTARPMQPVRLRIYDALGRLVKDTTAAPDQVWPGSVLIWDGHNDLGHPAANGVYLYRLEIDGTIYANKIVIKN